jgi:eukaryotic-like serine/threonine-protein kinase
MGNPERTEVTVTQKVPTVHDLSAPLGVGDVVAGRYEIDGVAGEGGMAIVFSARHLHLNERYAVKVMRRGFAANPNLVSRFLQEARAAAQLKSDHVCRVFDVGIHDNVPFMVMELLQGEDLRSVLERGDLLSVEEAVEFVIQACEALTEAHGVGLVHRDIKPENLFLTVGRDGWRSVKLLDFGISKLIEGEFVSTTLRRHLDTKDLLGTPHYMAPECIRSSRDASALSDVWSLGVVLYELLCGLLPFHGETVTEISASILETEPEPLAATRTDLPSQLVEVVQWCLAKQPELRVSSAAELATQLVPFAPRRSRATVERTQSRARARGEVLELPPSQFPPPREESQPKPAPAPVPSTPTVIEPIPPRGMSLGAMIGLAAAGFAVAAAATYWFVLRPADETSASADAQSTSTRSSETALAGASPVSAPLVGTHTAAAFPPEPPSPSATPEASGRASASAEPPDALREPREPSRPQAARTAAGKRAPTWASESASERASTRPAASPCEPLRGAS